MNDTAMFWLAMSGLACGLLGGLIAIGHIVAARVFRYRVSLYFIAALPFGALGVLLNTYYVWRLWS